MAISHLRQTSQRLKREKRFTSLVNILAALRKNELFPKIWITDLCCHGHTVVYRCDGMVMKYSFFDAIKPSHDSK